MSKGYLTTHVLDTYNGKPGSGIKGSIYFFEDLETYKTSQDSTDKKKAQILLNSIYSLIDKGSKKNIYHKNTAARKKAKLATLLKNA